MNDPGGRNTEWDDDIPSIDYRIRGFFNGKSPSEMRELLDDFLKETEICNDDGIFNKAIYLAQHPKAFENEDRPPEPNLKLSRRQQDALRLDAEPLKGLAARRQRRMPRLARPNIVYWRNLPTAVWHIVLICTLGAIIQGMDQAAVNGAQLLYLATFGMQISPTSNSSNADSSSAQGLTPAPVKAGLINAAPYLCCVVSCWFTPFLNYRFGRRGTILLCALFSTFFAFAQAYARTWQELFAFRLLMGCGIGPKSATIPIYAAESAPANIRGSLVTSWQAFTACGIAMGCIVSLIFRPNLKWFEMNCVDPIESIGHLPSEWKCTWNWRVILASPMVFPIVVVLLIYFCKESPRWTVAKAHRLRRERQTKRARHYYQKAFRDLDALSRDRLLAARDMFSHYYVLDQEFTVAQHLRDNPSKTWLGNKLAQLFGKSRNRRSITASLICMFAQQFWYAFRYLLLSLGTNLSSGVNVLIYYSNYVLEKGLSTSSTSSDYRKLLETNEQALLYTMGFGLLNFLMALPAFLLIDVLGRRSLLLSTFPFLALGHTIAAISFGLDDPQKRIPLFLVGFYLFGFFYSPGQGPVPFVYASESMALYIRDEGMGFVTSVNWLLNWLVAFTAPIFFYHDFNLGGTFAWYAAWCVILWFLILM